MNRSRDRVAFTLVELLVVVTIISILAATAMFVLFSAETYAREGKTRTRVTALHRLTMDVWESYASRRVNVSPTPAATFDDRKQAAIDAMLAMDMPDRWEEITGVAENDRSALSKAYSLRMPASPSTKHEAAECLYLIVAVAAQGLDHFHANDIGDVDGDGAPEFVDAWGRPIYFLRSAPGFPSPLVDPGETNPFPIVYSGGPDKKYGLQLVAGQALALGAPLEDGGGNPTDDYIDNIHSHFIFAK